MVVPGAQWLASYDPDTGQEIWRADDGNGETAAPRRVFGNGMVYVTTGVLGSARPQLWAIRVDGQGDVTKTHVAWKLTTQVPMVSSPVLVGQEHASLLRRAATLSASILEPLNP
jgi:outer membrane protein assembly factor BamB